MPDDTTTRRIPARPTVYKGVKMRSRLEAGFAQWLDEMGFAWEYEPECFASEQGQYLPDFVLRHVLCLSIGGRRDIYIEVKPYKPEDPEYGDRLREIIKMSYPDALFALQYPTEYDPYGWMGAQGWARTPDGRPALVDRIGSQPWPPEWWKGIG